MSDITTLGDLKPTELLIMEVLVARRRLGETWWPFATVFSKQLRSLEKKGFVEVKSGVVESIDAMITELGFSCATRYSYVPPEKTNEEFVDVVFDGPPAHQSGRFIEVEDLNRAGVNIGHWIDRGDGYWALRIPLYNNKKEIDRLTDLFMSQTEWSDMVDRENEALHAVLAAAKSVVDTPSGSPRKIRNVLFYLSDAVTEFRKLESRSSTVQP